MENSFPAKPWFRNIFIRLFPLCGMACDEVRIGGEHYGYRILEGNLESALIPGDSGKVPSHPVFALQAHDARCLGELAVPEICRGERQYVYSIRRGCARECGGPQEIVILVPESRLVRRWEGYVHKKRYV